MKAGLWAIGIIGVLFALMVAYGASRPGAGQRALEREVIDNCRKQQNDELAPLSERRFVRSVCDEMVEIYRKKWGREP